MPFLAFNVTPGSHMIYLDIFIVFSVLLDNTLAIYLFSQPIVTFGYFLLFSFAYSLTFSFVFFAFVFVLLLHFMLLDIIANLFSLFWIQAHLFFYLFLVLHTTLLISFYFIFFHSYPQIMYFAWVEVRDVLGQTKVEIKVNFELETLNIGFWSKLRCTMSNEGLGLK